MRPALWSNYLDRREWPRKRSDYRCQIEVYISPIESFAEDQLNGLKYHLWELRNIWDRLSDQAEDIGEFYSRNGNEPVIIGEGFDARLKAKFNWWEVIRMLNEESIWAKVEFE